MKNNGKRILSVTIKRMFDDSSDTSWMGEYSNKRTSEFSIDRAHAEDCASVSLTAKQAQQTLTHAMETVADIQRQIDYDSNTKEWEAQESAYRELESLADEITDCDCGEHGDMGRHEFRYFNPSFNYVDKQGNPLPAETPETVRKYTRQDYERMESLNRGDWCFIGVRAEAEIQLTATWENSVVSKHSWHSPIAPYQTITSGGLWGIESDSEESFIADEEKNQLDELRDQLKALGFSSRAISKAFQNVTRKED